MSLSARIALEAMPMTSRPQPAAAGLVLRKAAASSWTARRSSVVVDAIELACVGVAHEARAALSSSLALVGSGMAAGAAIGHARVWDVGAVQTLLSTNSNAYVHMTDATHLTCQLLFHVSRGVDPMLTVNLLSILEQVSSVDKGKGV